MSHVKRVGEEAFVHHPGADSAPLHLLAESAVAGCYTMLNRFFESEYPETLGVHEDHEGFYVISGRGFFLLEEQEYEIAPGTAMLAPKGKRHGLKKTGNEDLVVFIFHFPDEKGAAV